MYVPFGWVRFDLTCLGYRSISFFYTLPCHASQLAPRSCFPTFCLIFELVSDDELETAETVYVYLFNCMSSSAILWKFTQHLFNWSRSRSVTVSHSTSVVSLVLLCFVSHFLTHHHHHHIDLFALSHSLNLSLSPSRCLFNIKTINLVTLIITISDKVIWMHQIDKWQTGW